jgi:exopolysaccharide biosynthesis polyprenyl glycosylphosphotransferase
MNTFPATEQPCEAKVPQPVNVTRNNELPKLARKRRGLQLQISERRLVMMAGDSLMIIASVLISLRIWAFVAQEAFDAAFVVPQLYWVVVLVLLWLLLASTNDFYDLRLASNRLSSLRRLIQITLQLIFIYLIIFFLSSRDALPRLFILYHAALSFVLVLVWRTWRPFLMGSPQFKRRALIIGTGWAANTILEIVTAEASDVYDIIGLISDAPQQVHTVGNKPVLGTGLDLPALVRQHGISELIMAYGSELSSDIFQGIMACYEQAITMVPMPLLYEQITGRIPIEHVGQQHWTVVLPLQGSSVFDLYPPMKRLIDVLLSLFGLACFIVILPVIAAIMMLDSRGPIFYTQDRVGRGGRSFRIIKLRSMIPNAETATGPQWAQKNDQRVTPFGRFLRKSRLDEVPQLLNILRGEMSLIGPRPERAYFVDQLTEQIPFYRTRLAVKPGLTGWAQVRYRYGSSAEDALVKLQYDLYYIRHQSLALDLLILLRTVGKMLTFQGT